MVQYIRSIFIICFLLSIWIFFRQSGRILDDFNTKYYYLLFYPWMWYKTVFLALVFHILAPLCQGENPGVTYPYVQSEQNRCSWPATQTQLSRHEVLHIHPSHAYHRYKEQPSDQSKQVYSLCIRCIMYNDFISL